MSERADDFDMDGYPTFTNTGDNVNDESNVTPGTAPVRGISLRVTNIEGNPMMLRRGLYSTSGNSMLDGLSNTSKPVGGQPVKPMTFATLNLNKVGQKGPDGNSSGNVSHIHDLDMAMDSPFTAEGESSDQSNSATNTGREPLSFANVVKSKKKPIRVNFRPMESTEQVEGADVVIPLSSVRQVNDKYANTLYGYFLGKRLAFPVVDYFAKTNWVKYGLVRLMMNAKGFFFFKFKTKEGLDQLLEDGPWTIRNVPIILNEWSPNVTVEKQDIKTVPVWIKMHEVPLTAFTEDGLSLLASKVGMPKMLDSYTATMCAESWGRSSFARALVEIHAAVELKKSITVAIPSLEGNSHTKVEIKVEYDWEPLRCPSC
ncbi:hypothetical protein HanPI659440_Chr08g0310681 [Helianthus annuus]|nr:hypothetical protein HanPI659440_Chr08g0310681 [Helianthus annuus]